MRKALVLAGSLVLALPLFAKDVEHKFQSVVPRGAVKRVVIEVPQGNFTIRNSSSNELVVAGIASRDFDGKREMAWAQKVVNDTSVEIYVNGAEAVVKRKFGPNADSYRARKFTGFDLRLELPQGVDVKFETSAGDVDLAGDFGHVDLDLRAGDVSIQMPKNRVRALDASCRVGEVKTNTGSQLITKEGLFPGRTHFFNAAGTSNVKAHVTIGEITITLTP
ncbi:MAG TPA: hypothetical protein VHW00_09570 [Thermoanaerobaculia bacterium]|nr:hypothetical protein [Thermoanaerobaculia bacterium]